MGKKNRITKIQYKNFVININNLFENHFKVYSNMITNHH
jgi:hypothetical protein